MVDWIMKLENGDWKVISRNNPKVVRANSDDCTITYSRDGILVRRFRFARGTNVTDFEEPSINMVKKSVGLTCDPTDGLVETEILGEL